MNDNTHTPLKLLIKTQSIKPHHRTSLFVTEYIEDTPTFDFTNCFIKAIEGSGGFGTVLLIYDYKTLTDYVLKIDDKSSLDYNPEIEVYKKLQQDMHINCLGMVTSGTSKLKKEFNSFNDKYEPLTIANQASECVEKCEDTKCSFLVLECGICSLKDLLRYRHSNQKILKNESCY
jgi:hypothetical protein